MTPRGLIEYLYDLGDKLRAAGLEDEADRMRDAALCARLYMDPAHDEPLGADPTEEDAA